MVWYASLALTTEVHGVKLPAPERIAEQVHVALVAWVHPISIFVLLFQQVQANTACSGLSFTRVIIGLNFGFLDIFTSFFSVCGVRYSVLADNQKTYNR